MQVWIEGNHEAQLCDRVRRCADSLSNDVSHGMDPARHNFGSAVWYVAQERGVDVLVVVNAVSIHGNSYERELVNDLWVAGRFDKEPVYVTGDRGE